MDAKPDAAPTPDAEPVPDGSLPPADAPEAVCGVPGPDLCTAAMDLTAGASAGGGVTVIGDTTGLTDDLVPAAITCTGFYPDGPDAVYKITAGLGRRITAVVTPMAWDASVYIARACDDLSCVAGADDRLEGGAETVAYTTLSAGTYFIVVDGWDATAYGCYQLTVSLD